MDRFIEPLQVLVDEDSDSGLAEILEEDSEDYFGAMPCDHKYRNFRFGKRIIPRD
jgi:hypothetical protein